GVIDDLLFGRADEEALESVAAEQLREELVAVVFGVGGLVALAEFAALAAVVIKDALRALGVEGSLVAGVEFLTGREEPRLPLVGGAAGLGREGIGFLLELHNLGADRLQSAACGLEFGELLLDALRRERVELVLPLGTLGEAGCFEWLLPRSRECLLRTLNG